MNIPPPCRKAFAIVLLSAALALPAAAQVTKLEQAAQRSRALPSTPATVTSLTTPLVGRAVSVNGRTWNVLTRGLDIEARPNPQGMMNFGVGSDVRCAYGLGDRDQTQVVEFHNPTGRYSRGQPIARACPHWGPRKCSRTVTVNLGALGFGTHTYTVNRGYPRCPDAWNTPETVMVDGESVSTRVGAPALGDAADDIPDSRQEITATDRQQGTHNGIFTVRIWGKICIAARYFEQCASLVDNDSTVLKSRSSLNELGYVATFPPAYNCGPARWPTPELQAANAPPYAEWCDVTVDVRR